MEPDTGDTLNVPTVVGTGLSGIPSGVVSFTQGTTKTYRITATTNLGSGTITVTVTTQQSATQFVTIDYTCVAQPSPITIARSNLYYSGGNLPDSNSFDFEISNYPLGIKFLDTYCDTPFTCGVTRLIPDSRLYTVPYNLQSNFTSAPLKLTLVDYNSTETVLSTSSFLGSTYQLNSPAIANLQLYPNTASPTFQKPVLNAFYSVDTPASSKHFIKLSVQSSGAIIMNSPVPIGGSPTTSVQYLGQMFAKNPLYQLYGFNGATNSSTQIDSLSIVFPNRPAFGTPLCTTDAKFPQFGISNTNTRLYLIGLTSLIRTLNAPFPYGVSSGNGVSHTYSISTFASQNQKTSLSLVMYQYKDQSASCQFTFTPATADQTAPVLSNVEFTPLSGENAIITLSISDNLSGISQIILQFSDEVSSDTKQSVQVQLGDLVLGTYLDGTYQKVINYLGVVSMSVRVIDNANNVGNYFVSAYKNADLDPLIPQFPLYLQGYHTITKAADITQFSFKSTQVDVSNGNVENELYISFAGQDPTSTLIFQPYFYGGGSWNPSFYSTFSAGKFTIKFTVPARLFTGPIDYSIYIAPHNFTNSQIYNIVGASSQLRAISQNADQIGPLVSDIQVSSAQVTVTNDTVISFTVTIQDSLNGLSKGTIRITSDVDPVGYSYTITPSSGTGTKFQGAYKLDLPLTTNCISQTYQISYLSLYDTSGFHTETYDFNTNTGLDPLVKLATNPTIQTTCAMTPDTTGPVVQTFVVTPDISSVVIDVTGTQEDRTLTAVITASDNESGILITRPPSVYLGAVGFKNEEFPCTLTNNTVDLKTAEFTCTIVIPFGLGYTQGLALSYYGLFNNHFQITGKSMKDLNMAIATSTVKYAPTLLTYSGALANNGGTLTLYGSRFGVISTNTIVQIDKGTGFEDLSLTFDLFSQVVLVFDLPAISGTSFDIRVSVNTIATNKLTIPLTGGTSTTTNNPGTTDNTVDTGQTSSIPDGGSGTQTTNGNPTSSTSTTGAMDSTTQSNVISDSPITHQFNLILLFITVIGCLILLF
ncbi:hypothetical protein DLAC_02403 [Tieghemostelium lacteum]|uniref:Uncharacterized protein n=1 Tax=Tieghemostelium lacteum TaxID=361077 RepID=A0A152A4W9_TIELA|nr:hypothetical protein DLAC_02403 [Tieghemostelium lacteum]|eukprot:KYR01280.1 hypothetical protein DLAC_02403 [Tieghemostelium lacteum]